MTKHETSQFKIHREQLLAYLNLPNKIPPDFEQDYSYVPVFHWWHERIIGDGTLYRHSPFGYLNIRVRKMERLSSGRGTPGKERVFVKCFCGKNYGFGKWPQHYVVCLAKRESTLMVQLDMLRDIMLPKEAICYSDLLIKIQTLVSMPYSNVLETVNYAILRNLATVNWPWIALD